MSDIYTQANRDLWNDWTKLHTESSLEHRDLLVRLRTGQTTLNEIELRELGNVTGKSLLHLQCHFGLDTLSWAREGARVTGVDFSEEAIARARFLSKDLNLSAVFICADIYELPSMLDEQFDIVFTSEGVLPWLPDLDRWAEIITRYLKPGGTFYIRDGHPIRHVLLPPRIDGLYADLWGKNWTVGQLGLEYSANQSKEARYEEAPIAAPAFQKDSERCGAGSETSR